MATSLLTGCVAPVLLVFVLYTNTISALECFACLNTDRHAPGNYRRCDEDTIPVVDSVSRYGTVDDTSVLGLGVLVSRNPALQMTNGLFCMESMSIDQSTGGDELTRNIVAMRPSVLDQFGCYHTHDASFCFCQQDYCNFNLVHQGSRVRTVG